MWMCLAVGIVESDSELGPRCRRAVTAAAVLANDRVGAAGSAEIVLVLASAHQTRGGARLSGSAAVGGESRLAARSRAHRGAGQRRWRWWWQSGRAW